MRDPIGNYLAEYSARMVVIGWAIEEFIERVGDPRLWGAWPNIHLLREIINETGLDLGPFCVEDVVGYVWTTWIAPLRDDLSRQWEDVALVCPHCGMATKLTFSLDTGKYREECSCQLPQTCPSTPSGTSQRTSCSA